MTSRDDWGLTELGFRRPSHDEILDGFEHQAKERFTRDGKTPNLSSRSFLGVCLRIWAWAVNILFHLLEDVYNSGYVDTATGNSLYTLGRNIGMKLLPPQRASGYVEVLGTVGAKIPLGYIFSNAVGTQFTAMLESIIKADGKVIVPIQAIKAGPDGNVPKNTITQILNPLEGIKSVNNPEPTRGGRDKETTEQFRDRYYKSLDLIGGVNADGMNSRLLQEVEGIISSRVYENRTDEIDSDGRPPHCIEAVVFGGQDFSVADALYKGVGGIQTYGNTMVEKISPQNGQTYEIWFTRPTAKKVYFNISDVVVNREFPLDGKEQMINALITHMGEDVTTGLGIGEDVIYNSLPCHLLRVPGVVDFEMTIGLTANGLSKNNIEVSDREKAITSQSLIVVDIDVSRIRGVDNEAGH